MKSDEKLVVQVGKNETLGDFIQKCRQQYGWSQEELGWRTGITREHVGRIERGKCIPSVQTLYDLEKALNLPECASGKKSKWASGGGCFTVVRGEGTGGTRLSRAGTRLGCKSDEIESAEGK